MLNLGTTKPVARKTHRCENCGGLINPGQTYVRARVVDCGDAWVWKSHDDCQKASELLFDAGCEVIGPVCETEEKALAIWNHRAPTPEAAALILAKEALTRLRDCNWVITLPNRMDAVRDIAGKALDAIDKLEVK